MGLVGGAFRGWAFSTVSSREPGFSFSCCLVRGRFFVRWRRGGEQGPRAQQDPECPLAALKELPVGGRLLGQMVLVDLRDLPPVGQDTAENLGHRPLQSR